MLNVPIRCSKGAGTITCREAEGGMGSEEVRIIQSVWGSDERYQLVKVMVEMMIRYESDSKWSVVFRNLRPLNLIESKKS